MKTGVFGEKTRTSSHPISDQEQDRFLREIVGAGVVGPKTRTLINGVGR